MKRCWFGAALLLVLLAGGIWAGKRMQRIHSDISDNLKQAANAALQEDWARADTALSAARRAWKENWRISATFADHEPMEEIDSIFAQAEVYQVKRDSQTLAAACAHLSRLVDAMGEAHECSWWNIL